MPLLRTIKRRGRYPFWRSGAQQQAMHPGDNINAFPYMRSLAGDTMKSRHEKAQVRGGYSWMLLNA